MHYFINILIIFLSISILHATPIRIMPLGDSITNGITDGTISENKRAGYRGPLYMKLKDASIAVDFVGSLNTGISVTPSFDTNHEGHPYANSHDIAQSIYDYLSYNQPDIILLHIGTNDHAHSTSGVESILNEIDYYENTSGHTIRVIIAMIINRQGYDPIIENFNKNLQKLAIQRWENGDIITLVDMGRDAHLVSSDYANNTHPNNTGYAKMASVWFNELIKPYVVYSSAPIANDDNTVGDVQTPTSLNVTSNDTDAQNNMDVSTVSFVGGTDTDDDGDNDKLSISGEGIWRVDELGLVTFTPEKDFTSDTTPIKYTISDLAGDTSNEGTISIDYINKILNSFPYSLVDESYIESITVDEATSTIEFITIIPDDGITF